MDKRRGHSGSLLIASNWGLNLGGGGGLFDTSIYGNIVRCSFKSFEQCIYETSGHFDHVTLTVLRPFTPAVAMEGHASYVDILGHEFLEKMFENGVRKDCDSGRSLFKEQADIISQAAQVS